MQLAACNAGMRHLHGTSAEISNRPRSVAFLSTLLSHSSERVGEGAAIAPALSEAHAFLTRRDCTPLWACACIGRQFVGASQRCLASGRELCAADSLDPLLLREVSAGPALSNLVAELCVHTRAPHALGTRAAALDALSNILEVCPRAFRLHETECRDTLTSCIKDALCLNRAARRGEAHPPELAASRAAMRLVSALLDVPTSNSAQSLDQASALNLWKFTLSNFFFPFAISHSSSEIRASAMEALCGNVTSPEHADTANWRDVMMVQNKFLRLQGSLTDMHDNDQSIMYMALSSTSQALIQERSAAVRSAACRASARVICACLHSAAGSAMGFPPRLCIHFGDEDLVSEISLGLETLVSTCILDSSTAVRILGASGIATVSEAIRDLTNSHMLSPPCEWCIDVVQTRRSMPSPHIPRGIDESLFELLVFSSLLCTGLCGSWIACAKLFESSDAITDMEKQAARGIPPSIIKARPHGVRAIGCLLAATASSARQHKIPRDFPRELPRWVDAAYNVLLSAAAPSLFMSRPLGGDGRQSVQSTGLVASKSAWNACVALRELVSPDCIFASKRNLAAECLAVAAERSQSAKVLGHAASALAILAVGLSLTSPDQLSHDETISFTSSLSRAIAVFAKHAQMLDEPNYDAPVALLPWLAYCLLGGLVRLTTTLLQLPYQENVRELRNNAVIGKALRAAQTAAELIEPESDSSDSTGTSYASAIVPLHIELLLHDLNNLVARFVRLFGSLTPSNLPNSSHQVFKLMKSK